jgi:photosystem II stability/assembly factor-like uncharacterized protein
VFTLRRFNRNLSKKSRFFISVIKSNTVDLFSKKDFLIIAFFTLLGLGGAFAATLITISTPDSQGAGYLRATACDENVTIRALTASDTATGQLYVATIALSDISQNATTGCGNKTMQVALKINNQMRYATWDIPEASTDSTFYLTGATSSLSDYYADTLLSPFQADGLTNVAIAKIGSFTGSYLWTRSTNSKVPGYHYWVTLSSDGTKLAAVTENGYIYTSADSGVTWTARLTDANRNWRSIAGSTDGTKLAAVAYNNNYIYTSTNSGVTWTQQTSAGQRNWFSIASSSDGTKLIASTLRGPVYISTDSGANWSLKNCVSCPNSASIWQVASSENGNVLTAIGNPGYIWISQDSGATWDSRTATNIGATMGTTRWGALTSSSSGQYLVATEYGTSGTPNTGYIWTSSDYGATWTARTTTDTGETLLRSYWVSSLTSSGDGKQIAASSGYGSYNSCIYTSSDYGVTWTTNNCSSGSKLWGPLATSPDGSKFAAIDYDGYIWISNTSKVRSSN